MQELFKTWDLAERDSESETHVMKSFVADEADGIQYAHTALVRLLDWEVPVGEMTNWWNLARQEKIVKSIADFRSVLRKALDQKVVSMILDVRPNDVPGFLTKN